VTQEIPNADLVSIGISDLAGTVEVAMSDDHITPCEKFIIRGKYGPLQRLARRSAFMQQLGVRLVRVGRPDKNLLTLLKALCADEEKAAVGWTPTTADEFELAA
jgi:hypothetical protein